MKVRFVAPALAAAALFVLTASSAQAGLFSHGCGSCGCEPSCGAPAVVWGTCCAPQPSWCDCGPSCCDVPCHRGLGLLSALKGLRPRLLSCHSCNSCCDSGCGCVVESSCGCASSCDAAPACEPSCGAPAAAPCGCAAEPSCGCAAEPACGCEPACCEPACDPCCKPRFGLLKKLFSRHRCCAPACCVEVSCGCAAEPSCGCAAPSCGCN